MRCSFCYFLKLAHIKSPPFCLNQLSSKTNLPLSLAFPCYFEKLYAVCQSCPTLCNPMDRSPSSSSVHGILQARIPLEWVAISFSKGSSWSRDWMRVFHMVGGLHSSEQSFMAPVHTFHTEKVYPSPANREQCLKTGCHNESSLFFSRETQAKRAWIWMSASKAVSEQWAAEEVLWIEELCDYFSQKAFVKWHCRVLFSPLLKFR